MLPLPRRSLSMMRIFPSAERCFCLARRKAFTAFSAATHCAPGLSLICTSWQLE